MALSIVKHYISLLSQTFMLSDLVIMISPSSNAANTRPPLLPIMSHSLSTAYHLQKIFAEVQECINDIISLNISTDVNQGLKSLLESLQWRFQDVLSQDWLRGEDRILSWRDVSLICWRRCNSILSPRDMDCRTRRTDCYIFAFTIWTLSKTLDNRSV